MVGFYVFHDFKDEDKFGIKNKGEKVWKTYFKRS